MWAIEEVKNFSGGVFREGRIVAWGDNDVDIEETLEKLHSHFRNENWLEQRVSKMEQQPFGSSGAYTVELDRTVWLVYKLSKPVKSAWFINLEGLLPKSVWTVNY